MSFFSINYYSTTEEEKYNNFLYIRLGSFKKSFKLPPFIKCQKNYRSTYIEYVCKNYGFAFYEDYAVIHYGLQNEEQTYKQGNYTIFNYFWEYDFAKWDILDLDGKFLMPKDEFTDLHDKIYSLEKEEAWKFEEAANLYQYYKIVDPYDDEKMEVKCYLSEMTWVRGKGILGKILQLFCKPLVCKKIDINFSKEFGSGKNTWKGGILQASVNMNDDETLLDAMIRYVGHQKYMFTFSKFSIQYPQVIQLDNKT